MRTRFYPQQWLLCHMGLYYFEFEFEFLELSMQHHHTAVGFCIPHTRPCFNPQQQLLG
jgi:hypothetical protein